MRHKSTELMGTIKAFVEEYYKNYRHSPSTTAIADEVGIARGTAYKYLVANENTLKRYFVDKENQKIRLHSENKTMKDIIVSDCKIQGVAVKVIKNLE